MLYRALKSVENGLYIDIGAAWPTQHSVTKAFYDRGWSGINVEPNSRFFEMLEKERPRDINLQLAVGDTEGTADFHLLEDTGLSTLSSEFANQQENSGFRHSRTSIGVTTLPEICN